MMDASFPRRHVGNTSSHSSFFSLMGYGIKLLFQNSNLDDNNDTDKPIKNTWKKTKRIHILGPSVFKNKLHDIPENYESNLKKKKIVKLNVQNLRRLNQHFANTITAYIVTSNNNSVANSVIIYPNSKNNNIKRNNSYPLLSTQKSRYEYIKHINRKNDINNILNNHTYNNNTITNTVDYNINDDNGGSNTSIYLNNPNDTFRELSGLSGSLPSAPALPSTPKQELLISDDESAGWDKIDSGNVNNYINNNNNKSINDTGIINIVNDKQLSISLSFKKNIKNKAKNNSKNHNNINDEIEAGHVSDSSQSQYSFCLVNH